MTEATASSDRPIPTCVAEALDLVRVSDNVFMTAASSATDRRGMYGGQLAAQALRAAANTVAPDRPAHSLHGYFLTPGDGTAPVLLRVERDRDGRRYSTRRVHATQQGATILHLAASFHRAQDGPDYQSARMPAAEDPDTLPAFRLDRRMLDLDARLPHDAEHWHRWPTRLWIRVREPLDDEPHTHACALAFLSDMCTGLSKAPKVDQVGILPSLDHSLWLHRPVRADEWVLMDLRPESTSAGRGLYTGRIYDREGRLVASLSQESLFRVRPQAERLPNLPGWTRELPDNRAR